MAAWLRETCATRGKQGSLTPCQTPCGLNMRVHTSDSSVGGGGEGPFVVVGDDLAGWISWLDGR